MSENTYTAEALRASYRGAMQAAEQEGVLRLNRASAAGFLLVQHDTVRRAIASCELSGFWGEVRELLSKVETPARPFVWERALSRQSQR